MKPNFALTLTFDTITLSRRTARGWMTVGEVATDSADLPEALSYLRSKALGLSPQGFTTKVILPNSEVLYTEVAVDGPPGKRQARVRAALDGLTPYAVDELAFDMQGDGPMVRVAVVARETLEQAEDFATQHRFNPISFVAVPESGAFAGEAFFGQTKAAADLIAPGETVERDAEPTVISPMPTMPDPVEAAAPVAEPAPSVMAAPAPPAAEQPKDEAPAAAVAPATPEAIPEEKPAPKAEAAPRIEPAAEPAVPVAKAEPEPQPVATPEARPVPTPSPARPATSTDNTPPAAEPAKPAATLPDVAQANTPATDAPAAVPEAQKAAPPPATPPEVTAQAEGPRPDPVVASTPTARPAAPPADLSPPAFSSRRREPAPPDAMPRIAPPVVSAAVTAPPLDASPQPKVQTPPVAGSPAPPTAAAPVTTAPADVAVAPMAEPAPGGPLVARRTTAEPPMAAPPRPATPAVAAPPVAAPAAMARGAEPALQAKAAPAPPMAPPPMAQPRAGKPAVAPLPKARGVMGLVTAATLPGKGTKARPQAPAGATAQTPPNSAGPRSLSRPPERTRGKPRFLGLFLTGMLLVFLALVAAWSSFYLSRNDVEEAEPTRVATTGTDDAGTAGVPVAPAPLDVTAGDRVDLPPAPDPVPETVADAAPVPETVTAEDEAAVVAATEALPQAETPTAEAAPEPAPAGAATLTETAGRDGPLTAPVNDGSDEIYLSTLDAPPPSFDAVALPPVVAVPDAPPAPPMAPPPFGTVYSFDADGRIAAGERGVVTPDGVWLIAARPPVIPPARPDRSPPAETTAAAAPVAETAPLFPPAETAPEVVSGFQPDNSVNARRPAGRPAGLTPPATPDTAPEAQAEDDAALPAATDPRLASLRPRPRGTEILARVDAARQAAAGASLVQAAAAAPAAPAAFSAASALAVPISRRPAPRPRDFSRAVAAAVAAATSQTPAPAAASTAQRSAPAVEPDEEDEPELTATAAPRIPTRADVARQATFANAINLSKINLIGIYGTSSNRYALVRTANGRYNKIKVGDRVDGGTVAAITASEVRYQKSGRMLSLQMPRG